MSESQAITDDALATPEAQRAAIEVTMRERLGEQWQDHWILVHDAHDLVRVHRDKINLDFQADLLGVVSVIERPAHPLQLSGRLIALSVLVAFLLLALVIAVIAGVFG